MIYMAQRIEIHEYLPHTEPMLMVDYITSLDREHVKTVFEIKAGNIFVENDVFCESGLSVNAAQTCSAIVARSYFVDEEGNDLPKKKVIGFISSVKSVKIHSLPQVGSLINTEAELKLRFDAESYITCLIGCKSYRGDELLLEGEINLMVREA